MLVWASYHMIYLEGREPWGIFTPKLIPPPPPPPPGFLEAHIEIVQYITLNYVPSSKLGKLQSLVELVYRSLSWYNVFIIIR